MTYKLGMHQNIPMADYVADRLLSVPTLNAGTCFRIYADCPYQAWFEHPRLNPAHVSDSATPADIGSVAHDLLLGGEGKLLVIDAPDWRTKDAKAQRESARVVGLTPILAHKMAEVRAMVHAAKDFLAESEIPGIFDSGVSEATMLWDEDGVLCRCRPDWLDDIDASGGGFCLHYKTTQGTANPEKWVRTHLVQQGYDVAAAFYQMAMAKAREQLFLVQSQTAPYSCSLVGLSKEMMQIAQAKVERGMALWADCLKSGRWPRYSGSIYYAEPTSWQMDQALTSGMLEDISYKERVELGSQA